MVSQGEKFPSIYLVSGKGGVGKSSVAAATAMSLAKKGRKTLLIELGQRSYFQECFGVKVTFQPQNISPGLFLSIWDGEDCLRELISHFIRVKRVVDLFFENKVMDRFIKVAPALKELALLGKLTSGPRNYGPRMNFDALVLDAYSSGHFMALLKAPRALGEVVKFGPLGEQSLSIDKTICDPQICKLIWVGIAEEFSVQESTEFTKKIHDEFGIRPIVVGNKFYEYESLAAEVSQAAKGDIFAAGLLKKWQKQQEFRPQMQSLAETYYELPWIYENDPQKRIQIMSAEIEKSWKL